MPISKQITRRKKRLKQRESTSDEKKQREWKKESRQTIRSLATSAKTELATKKPFDLASLPLPAIFESAAETLPPNKDDDDDRKEIGTECVFRSFKLRSDDASIEDGGGRAFNVPAMIAATKSKQIESVSSERPKTEKSRDLNQTLLKSLSTAFCQKEEKD